MVSCSSHNVPADVLECFHDVRLVFVFAKLGQQEMVYRRGRDLLVFLFFLFRKRLDSRTHPVRGNENPACLDESAAAGLIDVFHRYDVLGSGTEHE